MKRAIVQSEANYYMKARSEQLGAFADLKDPCGEEGDRFVKRATNDLEEQNETINRERRRFDSGGNISHAQRIWDTVNKKAIVNESRDSQEAELDRISRAYNTNRDRLREILQWRSENCDKC